MNHSQQLDLSLEKRRTNLYSQYIATTLQRNFAESGHFYDAMILQQYCKYIAQCIYNIITLQ